MVSVLEGKNEPSLVCLYIFLPRYEIVFFVYKLDNA